MLRDPTRRNLFSGCPVCFFPIAIRLHTGHLNASIKDYPGNIAVEDAFKIEHVYPAARKSESPENVPQVAADAFIEGADNARDGRYSSAVMMFRRAIDVGTKVFEPTIDVHNLGKRIDKLAADGLITKDLKEWAHKIRLEGNEAVHDLPKPTKEQTEELQLFTELVLTYLFTLPAKVRANLPTTE